MYRLLLIIAAALLVALPGAYGLAASAAASTVAAPPQAPQPAAGVDTGQELSTAELVRVIRAAGRDPVERDTLYNVVRRYDGDLAGA